MKLSESIRRGLLSFSQGNIRNAFRIRPRRNTLFFEELEADYVLHCERSGFRKDMTRIGFEWMSLVFDKLVPRFLRRLSPEAFLNNVMSHVWSNLGLMDSFSISRDGDTLLIKTRNESITRLIGLNGLVTGSYQGIINSFFGSGSELVNAHVSGDSVLYEFRLRGKPERIPGKSLRRYTVLNKQETGAYQTMLKNRFLVIKGNRVYFRNRLLTPVESTIFSILGIKAVLLHSVPELSRNFFAQIISGADKEQGLRMMKNLFEAMGWGRITIVRKPAEILAEARNPPCGLARRDNWDYMIMTMLGFIKAVYPDAELSRSSLKPTSFSFSASIR